MTLEQGTKTLSDEKPKKKKSNENNLSNTSSSAIISRLSSPIIRKFKQRTSQNEKENGDSDGKKKEMSKTPLERQNEKLIFKSLKFDVEDFVKEMNQIEKTDMES